MLFERDADRSLDGSFCCLCVRLERVRTYNCYIRMQFRFPSSDTDFDSVSYKGTHIQMLLKMNFSPLPKTQRICFHIDTDIHIHASTLKWCYRTCTEHSECVYTSQHRMLYMCMLRVNHIKYYTVNDNNKIIAYTFSAKTFTTTQRERGGGSPSVQAIATTIAQKNSIITTSRSISSIKTSIETKAARCIRVKRSAIYLNKVPVLALWWHEFEFVRRFFFAPPTYTHIHEVELVASPTNTRYHRQCTSETRRNQATTFIL